MMMISKEICKYEDVNPVTKEFTANIVGTNVRVTITKNDIQSSTAIHEEDYERVSEWLDNNIKLNLNSGRRTTVTSIQKIQELIKRATNIELPLIWVEIMIARMGVNIYERSVNLCYLTELAIEKNVWLSTIQNHTSKCINN